MNDNRFTTGELWYIVNSLVDLACYLKSTSTVTKIYKLILGSTVAEIFAYRPKGTSKSISFTARPVHYISYS